MYLLLSCVLFYQSFHKTHDILFSIMNSSLEKYIYCFIYCKNTKIIIMQIINIYLSTMNKFEHLTRWFNIKMQNNKFSSTVEYILLKHSIFEKQSSWITK